MATHTDFVAELKEIHTQARRERELVDSQPRASNVIGDKWSARLGEQTLEAKARHLALAINDLDEDDRPVGVDRAVDVLCKRLPAELLERAMVAIAEALQRGRETDR